jgi:hypothetical protein|nr:DUF417 family protein [uncultured Campylobacter sp.]
MREIVKKFVAGDADIIFARLSVIIVLAVMGNYKWFEFEVEALKPLFSQTWLSFLPSALGDAGASYFLGVVETAGYLSLIAGFFKPKAGIVGGSHRDRHGAEHAQPTASAGQDQRLYL